MRKVGKRIVYLVVLDTRLDQARLSHGPVEEPAAQHQVPHGNLGGEHHAVTVARQHATVLRAVVHKTTDEVGLRVVTNAPTDEVRLEYQVVVEQRDIVRVDHRALSLILS